MSKLKEGDQFGQYKLIKRLGAGSFGELFYAKHIETNQTVALKTALITEFDLNDEDSNSNNNNNNNCSKIKNKKPSITPIEQLINEFEIYKRISHFEAIASQLTNTYDQDNRSVVSDRVLQKIVELDRYFGGKFAQVYWLTENTGQQLVMCMQLLNKDLESLLRQRVSGKFSLKTVLMIGDQLLTCIEKLHLVHFVHCDIKPENIMIGSTPDTVNVLHLIDMGISHKYIDESVSGSSDAQHISYKEYHTLNGSARYASVNVHYGIEHSRRDDLESFFYTLVYFHNGSLPWQNVSHRSKYERYEEIKRIKSTISNEKLTEQLDSCFLDMINYIRKLKFDETPDYSYIRSLLKQCAHKHQIKWDWIFDWQQNQQYQNHYTNNNNLSGNDNYSYSNGQKQVLLHTLAPSYKPIDSVLEQLPFTPSRITSVPKLVPY